MKKDLPKNPVEKDNFVMEGIMDRIMRKKGLSSISEEKAEEERWKKEEEEFSVQKHEENKQIMDLSDGEETNLNDLKNLKKPIG